MAFLRKGELLPIKGYNFSVPSTYLQEGQNFPVNMHYQRGEMRKRDGSKQLGGKTLGNHKTMHLGILKTSALSERLLRITKRNFQRYNTATKQFDDFTGTDLTGEDDDYFDDAIITELDLYVFTNLIDEVRKFNDSDASSVLAPGQSLKAKFVEYLSPYLFVAHVTESGLTIPTKGKWSDSGNPASFNTGNAGSRLFTDDPTEIRGVKKLKDALFVYKEGMSYRGRIVTTADVMIFNPFETGKGLYAPRGLADADGRHFYMGLNDFYMNDASRIQSIGADVREYIFNRLNRSKNETCHALHVEQFKEVWFYITPSGFDLPTEIWKYQYELGFWYMDSCLNIATATNYKVVNTVSWDDLIGTWDEQFQSWDDQSGGADSPIQVYGDDLGVTTQRDPSLRADNGFAYTGRQETRDYTGLPNLQKQNGLTIYGIEADLEWLQLDVWAKGDSAMFYYSIDYGDTWVFIDTKIFTDKIEKYTLYFHIIAPQIRFKCENRNGDEDYYIRAFVPYYLDAGEIEKP